MDYVMKLGFLVVYGGRNDFLREHQILSDIWILKLSNLEWQSVGFGGSMLPRPRCNHASFVVQTQLIICGGMDNEFKLQKDLFHVELDQSRVDRTSPFLKVVAEKIAASFRASMQKIRERESEHGSRHSKSRSGSPRHLESPRPDIVPESILKTKDSTESAAKKLESSLHPSE